MSTTEGLQLPVMALLEVAGKEGTAAPAQMIREVPKPNVGVMLGLTVTANVVGRAHNPGVGVKI